MGKFKIIANRYRVSFWVMKVFKIVVMVVRCCEYNQCHKLYTYESLNSNLDNFLAYSTHITHIKKKRL